MEGAWQRVVRAPLWAHLLAIAFLLLALVPYYDHDQLSADEGAALAQLDLIDTTGSWTEPNPAPEIDPETEALPLEVSLRLEDGRWAPFGKHSPWIRGLDIAKGVAGEDGPLLVSVLSTIAAAAAAALLTRRIAPGAERLAAWVVGVGSPLLFDGYLVIAHSLGAALVGFAALAAMDGIDRDRAPARRFVAAAGSGLLLLATGLVRTEGVLVAIAVGAAIVVASAPRATRPDPLGTVLGLCVAGSGPAAYLLVHQLDHSAWGGEALNVVLAGDREFAGGLSGRWSGFITTWLRPAYPGAPGQLVLAGVGIMLLWAAALFVRRRAESGPIALCAGAGAALVCLRFTAEPDLLPGLLVAMPLLAGLVGLDRTFLRQPGARLLLTATVLFSLAVLGTQYSEGGAGEWGGRYFAVGLPLALPLAVVGFRALVARATVGRSRTALVAGFAVATVAMSGGALLELHQGQVASRNAVSRLAELRTEVGGEEPATVLATAGTIARFSWRHLDEGHWHTVDVATLARYSARLAELGEPVILFSGDPEADIPIVDADWDVEPLTGQRVFLLTPKG